MARGNIKMRFRVEIRAAVDGGGMAGAVLLNVDYESAPGVYNFGGLNAAVSSAIAFVNRFQSAGVDAEAYVFGKPMGAAATQPVRALAAPELVEKVYANVDGVSRGMRQRINAANAEPGAAQGLDADVFPDIVGAV